MKSLVQTLAELPSALTQAPPLPVRGRVTQVLGTIIKAIVPGVRMGERCVLRNPVDGSTLSAEVIGFQHETVLLTALGELEGLSAETEVWPTRQALSVPCGEALLGRVVDGLGQPLDGRPLPEGLPTVALASPGCNPMVRRRIESPLVLGIRALDTALTCGEGQRLGIFAAAGVGKSTLLAQIMRNTHADVTVLALIGERGREVRDFIERADLSGSRADLLIERENRIPLLTVHNAKGCEFETVVIAGADDKNFPNFYTQGDKDEGEEKVFYVAIPRAKKRLVLTRALWNGRERIDPSRFVAKIPEEYLWKNSRWDGDIE